MTRPDILASIPRCKLESNWGTVTKPQSVMVVSYCTCGRNFSGFAVEKRTEKLKIRTPQQRTVLSCRMAERGSNGIERRP